MIAKDGPTKATVFLNYKLYNSHCNFQIVLMFEILSFKHETG